VFKIGEFMSRARERFELIRDCRRYASLPDGMWIDYTSKYGNSPAEVRLVIGEYVVWTADDDRGVVVESLAEGMEEFKDTVEKVFKGLREVKAQVEAFRDRKTKSLAEKAKQYLKNVEIKITLNESEVD
jgi:hypothetical protein